MNNKTEPARGRLAIPRWSKEAIAADLTASLVVFLVAMPLCVGVAVASGVPAELGIITGIVGGLVVGALPGSTMQVSGPAAGLTVLVASAVNEHGLSALGLIVLGAGILQVLLGLTRLGIWFRAISPSVVKGMLTGIGLVLILGQVYSVSGQPAPQETVDKILGLPQLLVDTATTPEGQAGLLLAVGTLVVLGLWQRTPSRLRLVPAALIAVVLMSALALATGLPVSKVEVGSLVDAFNPIVLDGALATPALLASMVAFALIASAESLFSAVAVDQLHEGPKTDYNKELVAQGVGNAVCGLLGALPMTAVIVRSAANVRAGARTKMARVLHGVWLLLFVALLPGVLGFIPLAVLAALLIEAGWKLLNPREAVALLRQSRSEGLVLVFTAGMIVGTDLLVGTLAGWAVAVLKTAVEVSRFSVEAEHHDDHVRIAFNGNATFLRLPRLLEHLERVPEHKHVHLDMRPLRYLDQACHQAVHQWAQQRGDDKVEIALPGQAEQPERPVASVG